MHCTPEEVDSLPITEIERMGNFLWFEAVEENWLHEKNQDLYIGIVRKFRKDDGIKSEDPEDEEENVLIAAKDLSYKDAAKRKPGEGLQRAGDQEPRESPTPKGFGVRR